MNVHRDYGDENDHNRLCEKCGSEGVIICPECDGRGSVKCHDKDCKCHSDKPMKLVLDADFNGVIGY